MRPKQRIIFRADGNSRIGLGHVVRSLALAQMLRDEFECVFAIQAPDKALQEEIRKVCHGLILLPAATPEEERFVYELRAYVSQEEIVVLDGYNFGTTYQQKLKESGCALVCLDDIHSYDFVADVVLNQAGGVDAAKYKTSPYTKFLLGPKYALLRAPFLQASKIEINFPADEVRLLLNMGGADPDNHTLRIAKELAAQQSITAIEIVVGGAYKHLRELEYWLEENPKYKLHRNLSAEEMCLLMQSCAVAITSASGVAYEYAAVGGILYTLQTADNQNGLYNFLTGTGIALKYEQLQSLQSESIKSIFKKQVTAQRAYFDGNSDERLRQIFRNLALTVQLHMREATPDDLSLLFEWANDPEVRRHSFNPNPISLESHTRWFTTRLKDPYSKLYNAEVAGTPAAHIRFELMGTKAIISYLISENFRGKGLGHVVLQKGVEKLLEQHPELKLIEGLVQKENIPSVKAFEKAGFSYGAPDAKFPDAYRFILEHNT